MNPLSPWTGVMDDTMLRLPNVAGVVGRYRAELVRNYGVDLEQIAYDLTTADRDFALPSNGAQKHAATRSAPCRPAAGSRRIHRARRSSTCPHAGW
ncbi:hypothetical protein [Nocardia carnea]|uniref:hypothetical protein n=1 Tax=Nocardia carnea TaxID=37328 RepID=UPI00245436EE|nr:hypothetical protein [Nocardia carnea]